MKPVACGQFVLAFAFALLPSELYAAPIVTTLPATGVSNTVGTLNGTINPGGAATTAWFEWGLSPFSNTNFTAPVAVDSGVVAVAVTNLLTSLVPGLVYHGRLVASNAAGLVRGGDTTFGSPALTLLGASTMTNECHTAFADPGAFAPGVSLPIAGGELHSLALRNDGTVTAWGRDIEGQTTIPVGLSNVVALAAGDWHSLALKNDGTVAAWGLNGEGQATIPAGLSNVVAIAGGGFHSLALKRDGTAAAWGRNDYGQSTIPAGLSNVTALAGGYAHSLALKSDGTVTAWGRNDYGQSTLPVGLSNVTALAGGYAHSLALKSDGTVVAWGYNAHGQTAVPAGLGNVVALAGGDLHSLALKSDGTVVAWGRNNEGETTIPAGLSNVVAIAGGAYHSLAVKNDGTVVAWGYNSFGQTNVPVGLSALAVIVGGTFSTNNAPGVYTRTYTVSNSLGGIAAVTRTIVVRDTTPPVIMLVGDNPLNMPPNVPFIDPGATALDACGGNFTVTTNSTVNVAVDGIYSVRYAATDSSGNSATNTRTVIVGVLPIATTLPVTGASNTVATLNGTITPGSFPVTVWFEWGRYGANNTNLTASVPVGAGLSTVAVGNLLSSLMPGLIYHGRLVASNAVGIERGRDVLFSTPLLTLNGAVTMTNECHAAFADPGVSGTGAPLAVAGGYQHSLVLKMDGTVVAWGDNFYGQTNIPVGLSNVVAIAVGAFHNLALKSDGTVAAWGLNDHGQSTIPAGLSNVVALATEYAHSMALKSDGTITAWGDNQYGEANIPVGLSNVVAIAAGNDYNLALKSDGTVAAWGNNGSGQTTLPVVLSDVVAIAKGALPGLALKSDGAVVAWGYNQPGSTTMPLGLSNVVAIAAGIDHSLALKSDGTVAAWGRNSEGETTIPVGLSNVVTIAAGYYHSLAVKSDGTVVAWGDNNHRQATVPAGLRSLAVNLTFGGTFNTNDLSGTYMRTYSASNSLGGIGTAMRTVVVQDTTPPAITLLGDNPLETPPNVPFMDPGATALDACGGSFTVTTNSTVNVAVQGIYSVRYAATDSSGNSATNTRTVVVGVRPIATTLPVTASNTVATLNGTIIPGSSPVTLWFEWRLYGVNNNTNLTAPVTVDAGLSPVGVSNLLSGLSPGLTYRGRLVASNALAFVRGLEVLFGTPPLTLNGADTVTNECHANFADPGVFATDQSLAVAGGAYHSLALRGDGRVAAWGDFGGGQTSIPVGLSNVVALAGGGYHSLALKGDGTVAAWGANGLGQTDIPVGLSNVVAIAAGYAHCMAVKKDGTVAAWGDNTYGQTTIPIGLSNVVAIAGGYSYTLALKGDGTLIAWGDNAYGQTTIPMGLSNVVAIAARINHNLALKSDGTVAAWGANDQGQTIIPEGLSNVAAIAAGDFHSLALKSDGTVVAWGYNAYGQTIIPVDLSNVVAIAGGGYHNLAVKRDGTAAAWGYNAYGQTTIPVGLSALPVIVGGTFSTNNAPGVYTRTYSASNSLGGIATATRTIVVQDTLPPVITVLGSNPLMILINTPFVDPGATALDACGGSSALTTNNPVNVAMPGIYTVSYIATDSSDNSATNTRMVVVVAPPRVISSIRLGNGTFQFGFTNQPGVGFTVWASTNVTLPFVQWSNLGAPVESPAGTFLFTDPQSTNKAQRFYRVSTP